MVRLISQCLGSVAITGLHHSLCRQSLGALPVELEGVTDGDFLGTTLNPRTRRLEYRQPTARHQFRPFRTAGTDSHKVSVAYARICLASRIAFPFQQAEADVQTLVRSYTTYGYGVQLLKNAASSFSDKGRRRSWKRKESSIFV